MSENINNTQQGYVEVDKNVMVAEKIGKDDVKLYDVRESPFSLYGFYDPYGQDFFKRMPDDVASATSPGVDRLAKESVGGRVRFATDSEYIAIKAEMLTVGRLPHTPLVAAAGFDLYEDFPNTMFESRFVKAFATPNNMSGGYEQVLSIGPRKMRYFTINFPVHSCVKNLYVGIQESATLSAGLPYRNKRPIVIYGSSIVHGTGATRPGLVYSNILIRRLGMDIMNLGFSGNAKAEDAIVDYMSGLDTPIFICDYDYNAPDPEHLRATHQKMYDRYRESHPDTPYVVITRPNVATNRSSRPDERRDIVYDTFCYGRSKGDKNLWYIDGSSFFLGRVENDCTIDATHPNDMGYTFMADGIEAVIRRIMVDHDCLN